MTTKSKSMASVLTLIMVTVGFGFFNPTFGQTKPAKIDTVYFSVEGVCGMCKDRIENAALIKGVKKVEWNVQTGQLMAIYSPRKTDQLNIEQAIAERGHDTENVPSDPKAYAKLPACCAYKDGVEKH